VCNGESVIYKEYLQCIECNLEIQKIKKKMVL